MSSKYLQNQWTHLKRYLIRFTWGGSWAIHLPSIQRRNLTLFFLDGLSAAAGDKIVLTYITIYLLSLGATGQQIGILNSLSNLLNALLLLPAAYVVEISGERKWTTVKGSVISRSATFLMALIPFFLLGSRNLIWIIFALVLIRDAAANFAYPGWISLIGDIVPMEGRGRYFGARNFIMGLSGMIVALIIGEVITKIGEPLGYQLSFLLAATLGALSTWLFSRINEPNNHHILNHSQNKNQTWFRGFVDSLKGSFSTIKEYPHFIKFAVFVAVWNFAVNIAAPFFNVFLVDSLYLTAAMIGFVTVINTAASMLVQRRVGLITDKLGYRKVMIIFSLLIPVSTLLWGIWVRQYWHVIVIEAISGILWGGFNLVSFSNLLVQTPEEHRARFSAYHQILVTLSLAAGAALGSFLIPRIEFVGVVITSAGVRFFAALLFLLLVVDPKPPLQ